MCVLVARNGTEPAEIVTPKVDTEDHKARRNHADRSSAAELLRHAAQQAEAVVDAAAEPLYMQPELRE